MQTDHMRPISLLFLGKSASTYGVHFESPAEPRHMERLTVHGVGSLLQDTEAVHHKRARVVLRDDLAETKLLNSWTNTKGQRCLSEKVCSSRDCHVITSVIKQHDKEHSGTSCSLQKHNLSAESKYLEKSAGTGAVTKDIIGFLWICWNSVISSFDLAIISFFVDVCFWWLTSDKTDSNSSVSCVNWFLWPVAKLQWCEVNIAKENGEVLTNSLVSSKVTPHPKKLSFSAMLFPPNDC